MTKIIIIYSTTDGHTKKICSRLGKIIEQENNNVILHSIEDENIIDLAVFDKVVIGASIRYGKHSPRIYDFIKNNLQILEQKPNAFFSVNVVARKPEKDRPETNPYLKKFLGQILWKPKQLAVFAGKIDYQKYKVFDRYIIRMIMWMTKGPTDLKVSIEFTDWNKVDKFGIVICEM